MALAFWRDKRSTEKTRNAPRARGDGGRTAGDDVTAPLRTRARRRLIGAVALLLAAAILVPLLLDPAPRPVSDNIAIDIPSEREPFAPRLALPPVPDPGQAPLAPPPDLPPPDTAEKASAEPPAPAPAKKAEEEAKPASKASVPAAVEAKERTKQARPARAEAKPTKPEARAAEPRSRTGRLVLQAAALGSEPAARDLSERLRKAGFAPFIEKIDTPDGVRYRVRVGPYSTRDEAQRAQARLRALGVSATLITT